MGMRAALASSSVPIAIRAGAPAPRGLSHNAPESPPPRPVAGTCACSATTHRASAPGQALAGVQGMPQ